MCERNMDRLPLLNCQPGTWSHKPGMCLTGNQIGNLLVHKLALNFTEPQEPGLKFLSLKQLVFTYNYYLRIIPRA